MLNSLKRLSGWHFSSSYFMVKTMMTLPLWVSMSLLAWVHAVEVKNCHPGCHCEVESFGLFDSFSLTRVDCRRVGPSNIPIPIPLDTAHLDLSSNSMGLLSDTMLSGPGYTTLVSLDLSSNLISQVSSKALSRLRYLQTLDLSHNSLESLAQGCFSGLPLVDVDLSYNHFRDFDLNVFITRGHGEPMTVDLSHNWLSSVSRGPHGGVLHIQSMTLAENRLRSVPKLFGIPLRHLNLDGNPISCLEEGAFVELKDLVHLSLSGLSELSDIKLNSFSGLHNLQVLDLSSNINLKTLNPAVFTGLVSLQELNLSNSGVTFLPNNMLSHLPSIRSITLGPSTHCWRTQKQAQFHRQLGQVQFDHVLTCNIKGIVS